MVCNAALGDAGNHTDVHVLDKAPTMIHWPKLVQGTVGLQCVITSCWPKLLRVFLAQCQLDSRVHCL